MAMEQTIAPVRIHDLRCPKTRGQSAPHTSQAMHPKRIELLGDAQLVHHRKVDAFALAAVAQGRIVYFDFGFHSHSR
mgnify:CR=1 FL=1